MRKKIFNHQKRKWVEGISLTAIMTAAIVLIVLFASTVSSRIYFRIYRASIELNTVTSSEQAVAQVQIMMEQYMDDIDYIMEKIRKNMKRAENDKDKILSNLIDIRRDIVAITVYDNSGNLIQCWLGEDNKPKEKVLKNLSYMELPRNATELYISNPHVESLTENFYPWVVTIAQRILDEQGNSVQVCMDIQFSQIANYVDNVGIGQHGYCFIMNKDGDLIYHPQQQLINAGLKEEDVQKLKDVTALSKLTVQLIQSVNLLLRK